jgi:hypothetical protein
MPKEPTTPPSTTAPDPIEPRKKRAKIMSACGECRRKKTKCNGEQPCRNCQKSNATCVYPTASQMDDKRNHNGPSRAALEAIEDRLKTIEDMLKTILQSQMPVHDLDPIAVNNFLNKSNGNNRLPSIHNLSAAVPATAAVTAPPASNNANSAYHHHPHHTISIPPPAPPPVHTEHHHLPSPLGLVKRENEQYHHPHQQPQQSSFTMYENPSSSQQGSFQPMKKRKR